MNAVYISGTSFRVTGDLTAEFVAGRKLKCNCLGDGYKYCIVESASYSSPNTTVTTSGQGLTSNLSDVVWGLTTVGATGSLTRHGHDGEAVNLQDATVTRPYFLDWAEAVNARGSISGAQTIDLELGNVVTATITAATTFTISNPPATGRGGGFVLILTNGGAGAITWPTSVKWAGGTAPTLTASGVDLITMISIDAGTTWRGVVSGKDLK